MADKPCPRCNDGLIKCPKCKGMGKYSTRTYLPILSDLINVIDPEKLTECQNCYGSGQIQCAKCNGNGVINDN